jgi:hypothetical protein
MRKFFSRDKADSFFQKEDILKGQKWTGEEEEPLQFFCQSWSEDYPANWRQSHYIQDIQDRHNKIYRRIVSLLV